MPKGKPWSIEEETKLKQLIEQGAAPESIAAQLAERVWKEAISNKNFGCMIVSDEAHRICPQMERESFDKTWLKLATEGGRNRCPFWLVARRLSLVSKSVTVESQQNITS